MRGIASGLEFDSAVESLAHENWKDLTNEGRVGADRIFGKGFTLPTMNQMDVYFEQAFKTGVLSRTEVDMVLLSDITSALYRFSNAANESLSPEDAWTPKDLCDLALVKRPSFNHRYNINEIASTGVFTIMPYNHMPLHSGSPVTLFDMAAYISVNPLALASRVFEDTTVADLANILYSDRSGYPDQNGVYSHANTNDYSNTSNDDIADVQQLIHQHARFGETSLWLSLVSWNITDYGRIVDAVRLVSQYSADPALVLESLRLGGITSTDMVRLYDEGYSAEIFLPYLRVGITTESEIKQAIENDIDPYLFGTL